jgi:hypothetical protein
VSDRNKFQSSVSVLMLNGLFAVVSSLGRGLMIVLFDFLSVPVLCEQELLYNACPKIIGSYYVHIIFCHTAESRISHLNHKTA